jgi:FlaA1/EpsC-like NDP-sugar epimerase
VSNNAQQPRKSNASVIGLQLLVTFAATLLTFAGIDWASNVHTVGAPIFTTLCVVCVLMLLADWTITKIADHVSVLTTLAVPAIAAVAAALLLRFFMPFFDTALPGWFFVAAAIIVWLGLLVRFAELGLRRRRGQPHPDAERTIIVGSGGAAASLVQLIREHYGFRYNVIGCIDDQVLSARVGGKPILGPIDSLPRLLTQHRVDCVIIAIPHASAELVKRVVSYCVDSKRTERSGKVPAVKILPGVFELLSDNLQLRPIRPVQPEDLLAREPVKVDHGDIAPHVEGRVILVTGAGGSIGSELCRQIVRHQPSLLLLLGHGENSLFAIEEELRLRHGFDRTRIVLADVADAARIRSAFSRYRPHLVFHAAAHKHVPIVEANICEAARNNVLGTHVVALAAAAAGAAKFVLLSTDKAVNPTSVMGATKRLAEIISQSFVHKTGTEFVTVRFGNVLESRGSVVPIFKKQIENGGPVTVTHRDMQRYFMTIPEAVSLVLQAMAIGRDGQVLVLDMGEPVSILKLAETLITLSGFTPYRDIGIVETGVRPGEKLFEEILTNIEGMSTTSHSRLFIAQQERVPYDTLALGLRALEAASRKGDQGGVIEVLRNFVPSYQPGLHLFNGTVTGGNGATMLQHPVRDLDRYDTVSNSKGPEQASSTVGAVGG